LFVGVFLGSIWVHQPWRYYFFGDSWDVLYQLLTERKSILWPQNEHFIPLFKVFYFLQYKLFGSHHLPYILVLFALHAAIAVMVYRLGLNLSLRPLMSFVAALLFAFSSVHWEVTGWSFEQQFVLGTLFMLLAIDVFVSSSLGRKTLISVGLLSLAALLAGGPIAVSLPIVLTVYCVLRSYRGEDRVEKITETLLALWLPAITYFICATTAAAHVPGVPAPIPHLRLRDVPGYIHYTMFGTVYGVVLSGLTLLQDQTSISATLILAALAIIVGVCYKNFSSRQRFDFWFLVVFLFTPLLVIALGRLQYPLSSRYSYIPTVPFALLLVLCWEALQSKQLGGGKQHWCSALGVMLLGYYFAFHFAVLRKQNPAADRGVRSQQFLTIARRATYPATLQAGAVVLGPELPVPNYVCFPGSFPLWKAFQVLDGDTRKIVAVTEYLKNKEASSASNLVPDGGFETSESAGQWKTYRAASFKISPEAAHTGRLGADVTLSPHAAFSKDVIKHCPDLLPQTIFSFAIWARTSRTNALAARIIFRDSQSILESADSLPPEGDGRWHQLVISGLSPVGTCMVGVEVVNKGPAEMESALDDAILIAHPGTVAADGKL